MCKVIFEEHLFFGINDSFVGISEDLDMEDVIRLKVHDSNKKVIAEYFTSLRKGTLSEADYAHILANKYYLIAVSDSFVKTGYRFILSGDVEVLCIVIGDRVSIHSEADNKVANLPFINLDNLKEYVCKNFGGNNSNASTGTNLQTVVCQRY